MTDGKWHHVCVTWSTRDGVWEAFQDGVKKGSGQNLSAWHPIKPGGTFILGQEQVRQTVLNILDKRVRCPLWTLHFPEAVRGGSYMKYVF